MNGEKFIGLLRHKDGLQMRDFAVRCEQCKGGGFKDEEEEKPDEEEERSSDGEEEKPDEEEERSSDGEEEKPDEEEEKPEEKEGRGFIVEGYATTFGAPYQLFRGGGLAFFEKVERSAFDNAEMRDVILQYDHEGRVYARQSNGTLSISLDERGLKVRADLSGTEEGRKLYGEIRGGYTTKMSFCFTIEESDIEELPEEEVIGFRTGSQDAYVLHTIRRIGRVYDVSAVSLPANEMTGIEARKGRAADGRRGLGRERELLLLDIEYEIAR